MDIFGAHSHSVPKHRKRFIHSLSLVFSAIRLYLFTRTVSKTCSKNAGRVLFIRFDVILSLNFPLVHFEAYVNVNICAARIAMFFIIAENFLYRNMRSRFPSFEQIHLQFRWLILKLYV